MKILLVEDHPDVAEMTMELLQGQMGHEVEWAANGEHALAAARRSIPDLMLVDLRLPDMSGHEVARVLRQDGDFDETTLVALSGFDDSADRTRALEAGFDHFYTKPMDLSLLDGLHRRT